MLNVMLEFRNNFCWSITKYSSDAYTHRQSTHLNNCDCVWTCGGTDKMSSGFTRVKPCLQRAGPWICRDGLQQSDWLEPDGLFWIVSPVRSHSNTHLVNSMEGYCTIKISYSVIGKLKSRPTVPCWTLNKASQVSLGEGTAIFTSIP